MKTSLPRKALATAALVAALTTGGLLATPASAEASVAYCGDGRCTVYLSQSETRSLANGNIPSPPSWTPWQIKAAYWASAQTHRWIAGQYANRGWCSGFNLDIRPWASQGYFGYACSWR